ncbi:MAG: hypothetical protein QOI76_349 [Frankiales bacterium]|nr:hypothetical protein [Frankiales bacterium]
MHRRRRSPLLTGEESALAAIVRSAPDAVIAKTPEAGMAAGAAERGYRCVRVRAGGQRVEVVMSMSPMLDKRGKVTGVASSSRPVSDQERTDAR